MALCVEVVGGHVSPVAVQPADVGGCSMVLLSGVEAQSLTSAAAITHLDGTLQSFVVLPAGADFAAAWSAGFILPMALFMVSAAVAKIVNFWRN